MESFESQEGFKTRDKPFNKYEVARQIFESKITTISEQKDTANAYDPLLAKGIEGGLAKLHTYHDPSSGEVLKAEPIGMLNRNSFMYLVNNYVKEHGVDAVQFYMLDVGAVRQMDLHGAADYNLNRIAQRIMEQCEQYGRLPLLECRYGGDEFTVAVLGKLTPEQQVEFSEFQQLLQKEIASLTWNRLDSEENRIINEVITTTAENSETFGSPVGDKLYSLYLQRGVVLPKNEINKMLREMFITELKHNISIDDQLKRIAKKPHEYQNELVTLDSKLQYHKNRHQEYATTIEAALQADAKSGGTKQREFVLEFIEQVVYDQLLGEDILTFADFMDHYDTNAFADVIAIEGKFLKEANKLNYLQGDNVKLGLWDSVKKALPANLLNHLTIANRAGSFLLGIHKDTPEATVEQITTVLKTLDKAQVMIRGNKIDVPLGVACESDLKDMHELSVGEKIGELRQNADVNWYHRMAATIDKMQLSNEELKNIVNSKKYAGIPDIGEMTREGLHVLFYKEEYTFNHLLYAFFNEPKRAKERREQMQKVVKPPQTHFFEYATSAKKRVA